MIQLCPGLARRLDTARVVQEVLSLPVGIDLSKKVASAMLILETDRQHVTRLGLVKSRLGQCTALMTVDFEIQDIDGCIFKEMNKVKRIFKYLFSVIG